MRRLTTAKTMMRVWCETSSWTCNSHYSSRCRGWCRTNTGRRRLLLCPLLRMGWHEGGGMRRDKTSRMANEVVATEARTIIIVSLDGQIGRVWRVGPRHDPFNSVWTNPARAPCGAWAVTSVRSVGLARHDYFYYTKIHIYTCTIYIKYYKHLSMMFYWLDSFTQCLSLFLH
jgi:hypothetical protein